MWANMVLAYEHLPAHVKEQIAGLRARHSIEATFGASMPLQKRLALKAQFPDAEHPVVRTHPDTDEKVLFVNAFTTHFTNFHTAQNVRYGQDFAPGAPQLLQYLVAANRVTPPSSRNPPETSSPASSASRDGSHDTPWWADGA